MNTRTEYKLRQLKTIIIVWIMIGFLITLYDYLVLHTQYSLGTADEYSFLFSMAVNIGSAITGALIGGSILVFFVNVKYLDKPYGKTIVTVSISFIFIILFISFIRGVISFPMRTGRSLFDPESRKEAVNFFLYDATRFKNLIVWSIVVALTQLFLQMNSKFGYGVFWNLLRGKYNTPKEENRIFMFLDINSSTTIAERLGDEKYHELLKDFFSDITNPILDNNGEIYQYIGDEVVIAWNYEDGITDNHCLKCFFDLKKIIDREKDKYLMNYGFVPQFKAGLHLGKVVVGEIGIIKRDITYSGDVMNTASRIRNKCREFDVEMIASSDLLDALKLNHYTTRRLGAIKLLGKEREVLLSSVENQENGEQD